MSPAWSVHIVAWAARLRPVGGRATWSERARESIQSCNCAQCNLIPLFRPRGGRPPAAAGWLAGPPLDWTKFKSGNLNGGAHAEPCRRGRIGARSFARPRARSLARQRARASASSACLRARA